MNYVEEGDTRNLKSIRGSNKRVNQRELQERNIKSLLRKEQVETEKERNKIEIIEDVELNKKEKKQQEKKDKVELKKNAYEEDIEKCKPKPKGKNSLVVNRE